jgi:hypothetical protein
MSGRNIYLLTSLPGLGDLGSDPPLTPADFLAHVESAPRARVIAEAIFLAEDLRLREAVLAGEIDQAEPVVLTDEQLRDEAPLPACLTATESDDADSAARRSVDAVWSAYVRHVAAIGRSSRFVGEWLAQEVGLRNALAAARAKALGLDVQRCLVEPHLGRPAEDYTQQLGEWSAAATPLAALRALDQGRWQWLAEHERWFSFADDELGAYAAKLVLLGRWKRIEQAEHASAGAAGES